ncbi:MAG: hypothetical protein HC819_01130 [Cyclobacteriaceae bacterium]|nr:hypothetical protein [Cyclobacteriaceae bacterium]
MPLFIINEVNQNPKRLGHLLDMMGSMLAQLKFQLEAKVKSGEFREVDPVQLFTNIISMSLFPFLSKPIIQGAFEYDDEKFNAFLEDRKVLIPEIILNYLKTNH